MKYEFAVYKMSVEGHDFWVAESKSLKGCVGQGETSAEAISELEENELEWLKTAEKYGITIPPVPVRKEQEFSGKTMLRISPFTHERASDNAKRLGISLNQYLNDAVVAYNERITAAINQNESYSSQEPTSVNESNVTATGRNDKFSGGSNVISFMPYITSERKEM